jgi:hypothetical protein
MAEDDKKEISRDEVELLARRAGLTKAWTDFPEDVIAAFKAAVATSRRVRNATITEQETWPTMHVPKR